MTVQYLQNVTGSKILHTADIHYARVVRINLHLSDVSICAARCVASDSYRSQPRNAQRIWKRRFSLQRIQYSLTVQQRQAG